MSLDAVKRVMEVEKQASQQRGDKSKENDDGRGRKECKRNSRAAGGGCAPV